MPIRAPDASIVVLDQGGKWTKLCSKLLRTRSHTRAEVLKPRQAIRVLEGGKKRHVYWLRKGSRHAVADQHRSGRSSTR